MIEILMDTERKILIRTHKEVKMVWIHPDGTINMCNPPIAKPSDSGNDMCRCGHERCAHSEKGFGCYNRSEGHCDCSEFALVEQSGTEEGK